MKKEKIGFFKKMFLVITDFRTYPFLIKYEKFYKSFSYLLTLVLFVSLILSLNVFLKFNDLFNNILENYEEIIPEFKFSNGELNVSKKFQNELDKDTFLNLNTSYTYNEFKGTEEYKRLLKYTTLILVNNDKIIIEVNGEPLSMYEIDFMDFEYEFNKNMLLKELIMYSNDNEYKITLAFSMYISIFLAYFISVLTKVIFIACLISIISVFFGVRLSFANYLKIGIYAYTLPLIIEVIAICMIGRVKDYAYYSTVMLTYVYAIYAIRAIKLDAFLMMVTDKKNVKNISSDFENELREYKELVHSDKGDAKDKDEEKEQNDD